MEMLNEFTITGVVTKVEVEAKDGVDRRLVFTVKTVSDGPSGITYLPVSLWKNANGLLAYEGQPMPGGTVELTGRLASNKGRVFINATAAIFGGEYHLPVREAKSA